MTDDTRSKLLPRNVAALRRFQDPAAAPREVTGNPVMTRLESGVGNCFPGLECDLRNLERRFFPFLEVDIDDGRIGIVGADASGAQAGGLPPVRVQAYSRIARDIAAGRSWTVGRLKGTF